MNANEVEPEKLKNMRVEILALERDNVNTKEFSDSQMVDKIRKIIEREGLTRY